MPDDGYDTSLLDLVAAARNRNKSQVAPTDEGAMLVEDDEQPAPAANGLSEYELERLARIRRN